MLIGDMLKNLVYKSAIERAIGEIQLISVEHMEGRVRYTAAHGFLDPGFYNVYSRNGARAMTKQCLGIAALCASIVKPPPRQVRRDSAYPIGQIYRSRRVGTQDRLPCGHRNLL